MSRPLVLWIPGVPQPQGSRRHVGKGITVEANPRLAPWRADAIAAVEAALGPGWEPVSTGVQLQAVFWFTRPASHFGTGRNANLVRPGAPIHHTQRPDRDKLDRALCDALTQAGFWRDDAQCWEGLTTKAWTQGRPGVRVTLNWA